MISKPLTFIELVGGDRFIAFPVDSDDSGHGGYQKGGYIFQKLRLSSGVEGKRAIRCCDGTLIEMADFMEVYKVL
jgi:hypothetical protein